VREVSNDASALVEAFRARIGEQPAGVWGAPGRVNLIGEHTDYNDGYVMPFALAQRVLIAAAPRPDRIWTVMSLNNDSAEAFGAADLAEPTSYSPPMCRWAPGCRRRLLWSAPC
jgi:galactokinase